jgi:tetratricopeptide (TPR) repeat protein
MKTGFSRVLASILMLLFALSPVWATCGGGGGGGTGGAGGGGGSSNGGPTPVVYNVPWKMYEAKTAPSKGLVLYWFPASNDELKRSPLKGSRVLTLYSAQCVAMSVADSREPDLQKFIGDSKPPVAVLATADGSSINKFENTAGKLKLEQIEKAVDNEMKQRESALDAKLKEGKEKEKAGDSAAAIEALKPVAESCLFPKKAKEASKELKKLGVAEVLPGPDFSPVFARAQSARIEQVMRQGLIAEIREQYKVAEKYYTQAHQMDPADPTPLRYLGELYRHHIGDWEKARTTFESILNMPADSVARAVALHGLGKMTIHEGQFKKGLSLMEQSIAEFPLALAYRNLAVYWNSEGDLEKGNSYTQKALALDPKDPYNLVFAAVFMAASGHGDEALKIAQKNRALLPASYNLAAVFAQTGHKEEALAMLKRHFFRYERYQAVRAKEMMEARVDAVFDSLRQDSSFLALTSGADGRLQMPMGNMRGTQQQQQ